MGLRSDGVEFPVDVSISQVDTAEGKLFTGIVRGITEQQASQAQLCLLETSISHLNDMVVITEAQPLDEPGPRIVFVNAAFERHTGYSRAEVLGKSPRLLQGSRTQRLELDRIAAALRKWQPVRAELINYTKSGQAFWVEIDIVPIGLLQLTDKYEGDFTQQDEFVATELAQLASIAIENAGLLEEVSQLNAGLEQKVAERTLALSQFILKTCPTSRRTG